MVKGARKSKGCSTCRRRKIRCDLQQPTCQQCHKSRRRCGGYEYAPVFVVFTKNGMEKGHGSKESETTPASDSWNPGLRSDRGSLSRVSGSPNLLEASSIATLHSASVEESRYVGWAYENYIQTASATNAFNHMPVAKWLHSALTLAEADPALDQATLAISCRMCAVFYKDQALLNKSRTLYTAALGLLQRSLRLPKMALKDETLVATCLLAVYELTSLDRKDPDAWLSHVSGISALLKARGAKKHHQPLPRATLEHCRYNLMMQCISNRNASGFASKEWLDDPWTGVSKGIEQQVADEGLKLAQILQRIDEGGLWWVDMQEIKDLTESCELGCSRIRRIKARVLVGLQFDPDKAKYDFPPQAANRIVLRLTASAIQLSLCEAAHYVLQQAKESSTYNITYRCNGIWKLSSPDSLTEMDFIIPDDGLELAQEIVHEASEVYHNSEALPEVIRMMFPLRVAARILGKYLPSSPQYEQCVNLLRDLQDTTGGPLAKMPPKEYFVYGNSRQKNAQASNTL